MLAMPFLESGHPGGIDCHKVEFLEKPEFAKYFLLDQRTYQVCFQYLALQWGQPAQNILDCIGMWEVHPKTLVEVFTEIGFAPIVVVGIA